MSTVLWANYLDNGEVVSERSDLYALYRFSNKLDAICDRIGLPQLSSLHDSTDLQFNLGDDELPEGMESTDDLMAADGIWTDAAEARRMLESLLAAVREERPRFGLFSDAVDEVISELEESLAFVRQAEQKGALFNFSVVT